MESHTGLNIYAVLDLEAILQRSAKITLNG